MEQLVIPRIKKINDLCVFLEKLDGLLNQQKKISSINFIEYQKSYTTPLYNLILSTKLRNFIARGKELCGEDFCNDYAYDNKNFLSAMNFFNACGLDEKSKIQPRSSDGHISIQQIDVSDIKKQANNSQAEQLKLITQKADELTNLLLQSSSEDEFDCVSYCVREIMRNVVEHSESDLIWYCAQYWPSKGTVQIAILDEGIGLKTSLAQNPKHTAKIIKSIDAIKLALQPGVSKVFSLEKEQPSDKTESLDTDEPAKNSGYGLYMTSEICKRTGGKFYIGSEGSLLRIKKDVDPTACSYHQKGVVVALEINLDNIQGLSIQDITEKGEKMSGTLASYPSRNLRI